MIYVSLCSLWAAVMLMDAYMEELQQVLWNESSCLLPQICKQMANGGDHTVHSLQYLWILVEFPNF